MIPENMKKHLTNNEPGVFDDTYYMDLNRRVANGELTEEEVLEELEEAAKLILGK